MVADSATHLTRPGPTVSGASFSAAKPASKGLGRERTNECCARNRIHTGVRA